MEAEFKFEEKDVARANRAIEVALKSINALSSDIRLKAARELQQRLGAEIIDPQLLIRANVGRAMVDIYEASELDSNEPRSNDFGL